MLFRRRAELEPPNVASDWASSDDWRSWEAPRNFIAGESHYTKELCSLCGEPRDGGYLIPVDVVFVREKNNRFDKNAFRAEVNGRHIGYLPRHIAAQLAGPLDKGRCASFAVCGVMRGGSLKAPNIGVHVWLNRRPGPGPLLSHADDAGAVKWPPSGSEGVHCSADVRA
jgi:hypothetical protein